MMTYVRLDHPEQRAIAVHEHTDGYSVTIGNIPDADARAAQVWLAAKAVVHFGAVELSNIMPGAAPGRSEVYVVVNATKENVMRFCNEVLQITANQLH